MDDNQKPPEGDDRGYGQRRRAGRPRGPLNGPAGGNGYGSGGGSGRGWPPADGAAT